MIKQYNITDYIKDDPELQKAVIEEFLNDIKRLQAENEQLKALCDTYFTCYRAKHNDIEGNLFSYRKALEEIMEICKSVEFPLMSKMINIIDEVLK